MSEESKQASGAVKLAVLPTGEAIRPQDVARIRIEPEPMMLEQEVRRFAVVIERTEGPPWVLRQGLAFEEAISLSRRCGQAVNDSLAPKT